MRTCALAVTLVVLAAMPAAQQSRTRAGRVPTFSGTIAPIL